METEDIARSAGFVVYLKEKKKKEQKQEHEQERGPQRPNFDLHFFPR